MSEPAKSQTIKPNQDGKIFAKRLFVLWLVTMGLMAMAVPLQSTALSFAGIFGFLGGLIFLAWRAKAI